MKNEKTSSFREMVWNRIDNIPKEYVELFAYSAWEIWRWRNEVCFDKAQFDAMAVARRAHKQWQENVEGRSRMEVTEKTKQVSRWKPPSPGTLKLNCDVAVGQNGVISMGFVIRNTAGEIELAEKQKLKAEGDSTLLEGYAMRFAMQMARQYAVRVRSVESDSKNLVEVINGKQKLIGNCDTIIFDIIDIAREIGCMDFSYISTQINRIAHHAAQGIEFISIKHTPSHLLPFLDYDVVAIA